MILETCTTFINQFPRVAPRIDNMSIQAAILQYRTLVLGLPRRSGKTSVLKKLSTMLNNSIVITEYRIHKDSEFRYINTLTTQEAMSVGDFERGRAISPYSYVLLDEVLIQDWLFDPKHFGRRLAHDTIMISLYTPRM